MSVWFVCVCVCVCVCVRAHACSLTWTPTVLMGSRFGLSWSSAVIRHSSSCSLSVVAVFTRFRIA